MAIFKCGQCCHTYEEHPITLLTKYWFKLAQWFQMRSQIYEVYGRTTDDECPVIAIAGMHLRSRWGKKGIIGRVTNNHSYHAILHTWGTCLGHVLRLREVCVFDLSYTNDTSCGLEKLGPLIIQIIISTITCHQWENLMKCGIQYTIINIFKKKKLYRYLPKSSLHLYIKNKILQLIKLCRRYLYYYQCL